MSSLAAVSHFSLPAVRGPGAFGAALASPGGAAARTGRALSAALRSRTGVVGAVRGGLLRGLSNLSPIPHPTGTLVSLIRRGGAQALSLATRGARRAGALARAVGRSAMNAGRAVSKFFDSPAGRLLSTALSLAATFVPGGIVVKAGIGAIAGTIDALAKGGGLKQALLGAAAGAVEGAIPVAKIGALAKVALGSGKGALFAAAGGGGWKDIATGALGGAVGGAGAAMRAGQLTKFGGLEAVDRFVRGGTRHRGALARLHRTVSSRAGRRAWQAVHRRGRQAVSGAAWLTDRSGRAISKLRTARYVLDIGQGLSDATHSLTTTASEHFSDGVAKRTLQSIASVSGAMVRTLDEWDEDSLRVSVYAKRLNSQLPLVIDLLGQFGGAKTAVRDRRRSDERRRKHLRQWEEDQESGKKRKLSKRARSDLAKRDLFAHIDDFADRSLRRVSRTRQQLVKEFDERVTSKPMAKRLGRNASALRERLEGWEQFVRIKGPLVAETLHHGTEATKEVRDLLRSVILAVEEEGGQVDPSLAWLHQAALEWEARLDVAFRVLRAGHAVTAVATAASDVLPDPNPEFRERLDEGRRAALVRSGREPPAAGTEESADVSRFVRLRRSAGERASELGDIIAQSPLAERIAKTGIIERMRSAQRALSERMNELSERHIVEPPRDDPTHHSHASIRAIAHLGGGDVHETYRIEDWRAREAQKERIAPPQAGTGERAVMEIRQAAEVTASKAMEREEAIDQAPFASSPSQSRRFDEVPPEPASRGLYALLSRYARAVRPGRTGEAPEVLDDWDQELDARIDASFASGIEEVVGFALECAEALRLLREQRAANEALESMRQTGEIAERRVHIAAEGERALLDSDTNESDHIDSESAEAMGPTPTESEHVGEAAAARPLREPLETIDSSAFDSSAFDSPAIDEVIDDEPGHGLLESLDSPTQQPPASPAQTSTPPTFGRAVGKLFEHSRRRRALGFHRPRRFDVGLDRPRTLDLAVISRMEDFLGERLPPVRIHTGASAARLTRRLDADAATIGTNVFFAPGRYQPDSTEGRRLIAHELTHVLQRNRANLDTRTAEAEAHRAEAAFDAADRALLDLGSTEPSFRVGSVDGRGAGVAYTARRARATPQFSVDQPTLDEDAFLDELTDRIEEILAREIRDLRLE